VSEKEKAKWEQIVLQSRYERGTSTIFMAELNLGER